MKLLGNNMMLLFAIAILAFTACTSNTETGAVTQNNDEMMDDSTNEVSEPDVTFVVTGENFAFFMDGVEAPELRVKQGDLVRIEFTSTDGFHDWVVDEFDAATEKVQTGGSTSVEFVASETGTFEYYCSVGSHRANGMVGNLIVE